MLKESTGVFPRAVVLKVLSWISNISITWELIKNASSRDPPQTYWVKNSGNSTLPWLFSRSLLVILVRENPGTACWYRAETPEQGFWKVWHLRWFWKMKRTVWKETNFPNKKSNITSPRGMRKQNIPGNYKLFSDGQSYRIPVWRDQTDTAGQMPWSRSWKGL